MSLPKVGDPIVQRLRDILLLDKDPKLLLNKYLNAVYSVSALDLQSVQINVSAASTSAVVDAVEGYSICVYAILVVANGDTDVRFTDGTGNLTGDIHCADEGYGFAMSVDPPAYLWKTPVGGAFNLTNSAAEDVDGTCCY